METRFSPPAGCEAKFIVGVRKATAPPHAVERTGTVIVKRTYEVEPGSGQLTPAAKAIPVLERDEMDNLVINSDFESLEGEDKGKPIDWHPDSVTIVQEDDPNDANNHWLRVSGAANGRVIQTITFAEPLSGRWFWLSLAASADVPPGRVEGIQLEADGASPIAVLNLDLTTTMARHSASGTWPAGLEAKEMRVVLRMATRADCTVFYDNVQVEERPYETVYDPATVLRHEHDLAAFKPEGDVIVFGYAGVAGLNRLLVNDKAWLIRQVMATVLPEKALFGWEPRVSGERKAQAGSFDPLPSDPLPGDFDNRFYNGYRRTDAAEGITAYAPFPYMPEQAAIEVERDGRKDYHVVLRGDTAAATYYFYHTSMGPDQESNWHSQPVVMHLDTLVIEPERNRCYAVWRGTWPFADHDESSYRRIEIVASP